MKLFSIVLLCIFLSSCKTLQSPAKNQTESAKEVESALQSVASSIKGSPLTDSDLKKLNKQIREDKDAQTAVSSITHSMGGKAHTVKYCPKDGKRFAGSVAICPEHNVELRWVDE